MLTAANKNRLTRIIHTAAKAIGLPTPNLSDLNSKLTKNRAQIIAHNPTHPLNPFFTLLPSRRRYRAMGWKRSKGDNAHKRRNLIDRHPFLSTWL
ncbi:hypothetical protein AALO_G00100150 [Alosa alosa]|uniref:Uncharacterized protein n=1 Tax=Alosa alosa TaxID=278164 RepID=A0AAV6GY08_9TELE|nr:hypothetical protein AALO_G00100150 [Alosa alosa]